MIAVLRAKKGVNGINKEDLFVWHGEAMRGHEWKLKTQSEE